MMGPAFLCRPTIKFGTNWNIVCDGNSLVAGYGAASALNAFPTRLVKVAPLSNGGAATYPDSKHGTSDKGVAISNTGISGQTTQAMLSDMSDVNAAFNSAKKNGLILWEGTNSLNADGTLTAAGAAQQMKDYITAQKAVNNWDFIVLMTGLPRQLASQAQSYTFNARMDAYNDILRNTYRSMGATALVDVRAGDSPFAFSNYDDSTFAAARAAGLWVSWETPSIHLNDAGYLIIAGMVANTLRRLPAR